MYSLPKVYFTIPVFVLLIGSLLFHLYPLDMMAADFMHSPSEGWNRDPNGVWKFLYDYGVVPALILALTSFVVLMLGIGHPLRRFRKLSLYLLSCLALGPGLITNGLLKAFWGRPRPKQISDFGGEFEYEPLLTIDLSSSGKSFPCGHATMGFYFLSLGLALRHRNRNLSNIVLFIGLILGTLIGYARLVQGGHFPSDTLWAAGVCWGVSLGLYYAFKLHTTPLLQPTPKKKRAWWVLPALVAGCLSLVAIVSFATPYDKSSSVKVVLSNDTPEVDTIILDGFTKYSRQDSPSQIQFTSEGNGHRFPKSRHKVVSRQEGKSLILSKKVSGIFTELNLKNTLTCPKGITVKTP